MSVTGIVRIFLANNFLRTSFHCRGKQVNRKLFTTFYYFPLRDYRESVGVTMKFLACPDFLPDGLNKLFIGLSTATITSPGRPDGNYGHLQRHISAKQIGHVTRTVCQSGQ